MLPAAVEAAQGRTEAGQWIDYSAGRMCLGQNQSIFRNRDREHFG
jgi:hypothetical protein